MSNTILRLPAVKARTGFSRASIYAKISEGTFPKPVSIGPRAVGWIEKDIDAWVSKRIEKGWVTRDSAEKKRS